MTKAQELSNPTSCLNRAKPGELIFVILAHDIAAPHTIRQWVRKRIRLGKNNWADPQIVEALAWADTVELQHRKTEQQRASYELGQGGPSPAR